MSQENVEVVRRSLEATNTGGVEALLAFVAPDFVGHPFPDWVEAPKEVHGHKGLRIMHSWITDNFEDPAMEVHEIRDAGDRVLALYWQTGRIKGSVVPIRQQHGAVFSDFREDGRIGEASFFLTWREALDAAGLQE